MTSLTDSNFSALPTPANNTWTRYAPSSVQGDSASEKTLSAVAQRVEAQAKTQGYLAGWKQGIQEAKAQAAKQAAAWEEEKQTLLNSMEKQRLDEQEHLMALCTQLQRQQQEIAAEWEVKAAQTVVKALVAVLPVIADQLTGDAVVHHCLELLEQERTTQNYHTFLVSSSTFETLTQDTLLHLSNEGFKVVADSSLQPGDCVALGASAALDLRVGRALKRIVDAICQEVPDARL